MLVARSAFQKPFFTSSDKARHRQKLALKSAARLETSALLVGDAESLAIADCIRETASDSNYFFSVDQVNFETGEVYDGYGTLENAVASRLDINYCAKQSRRAKRAARKALAKIEPVSGERLRFLTLTMPDLRADFKTTLAVLDYALSLFKKRAWFKSNVRGGVFGMEFTVGAENHYHFHAHALLWSRWLAWHDLGEIWADCVCRAAVKFGVVAAFNTDHGRAVVDVRLVTKKASNRATIALDDAVDEVCKYLAKGSDFDKIPASELCDVERALRRRQMLKTFGECNERKGTGKRVIDNRETSENATTFLDTTNIIDAATRTTHRAESLVKIGERMIKEGRRDEWLSLLRSKLEFRRAFRRKQLAEIYPMATFWTLDGRSWSNAVFPTAQPPGNVVDLSNWRRYST